MRSIIALIAATIIGAGVPIFALYHAFKNAGQLSGWAWVGITLICIVALGCSIAIFALSVGIFAIGKHKE
ncbi:MAG: hypothetical protein AB1393_03225 [Candidatus Edwardsbacteria bacterium]